jgi:hypothetical protein
MKLKRKSKEIEAFVDGLHKHIISDKTFRKMTLGKSEVQIQGEIRPIILDYLKKWFKKSGVVDYENKAHKSFYWEGQESRHEGANVSVFGAYNYPDFIIKKPYNIAIEYKQSPNGSTVKQGVGQSIMLTQSGEYDFVYYLFNDQSPSKKIVESLKSKAEKKITSNLWVNNNVRFAVI